MPGRLHRAEGDRAEELPGVLLLPLADGRLVELVRHGGVDLWTGSAQDSCVAPACVVAPLPLGVKGVLLRVCELDLLLLLLGPDLRPVLP